MRPALPRDWVAVSGEVQLRSRRARSPYPVFVNGETVLAQLPELGFRWRGSRELPRGAVGAEGGRQAACGPAPPGVPVGKHPPPAQGAWGGLALSSASLLRAAAGLPCPVASQMEVHAAWV